MSNVENTKTMNSTLSAEDKNGMIKGMLKDAAILFAITLIAGLILGAVYQLTKEPIAAQEEKAKTEARQEVFADAASFQDAENFDTQAAQAVLDAGGFTGCSIDEYAAACDADGNLLGYVITVTTHEGYSGDIQFTIGVRTDGTLNGMSILSISETAGLGMRAEEVLVPQFAGKKADSFVYTKSGASADNEIDAISSATITTSAVVDGVNAGLYYFQTELTQQTGAVQKEEALMNKVTERLYNGIIRENPTFVLTLGMCPTLAVTTSAMNGLGMGLSTTVVLALSNLMISALRKIIPDKVRIPAFIVIVASFVTVVQLLLQAYVPALNDSLGIYIPLIVVNCIILGRAESYASKNPPIPSLFDGIGMGLGFSLALTCIGAVRELLGSGAVFGFHVMPDSFVPISIFVMAPGAFFVLACLTAMQNWVKMNGEKKGKDMSRFGSGCGSDCLNCGEKGCAQRAAEGADGVSAGMSGKVPAGQAEGRNA